MSSTTTNIFSLEFIVKNLKVWTLPDGLVEVNRKCVDFTFMNIHTKICERDFDKKKNGATGKFCLFTLNALPSDEDKVWPIFF